MFASDYQLLVASNDTDKPAGLLAQVHDIYTTSESIGSSEQRLPRVIASMTLVDDIAFNMSQYIVYGVCNEKVARSLDDQLVKVLQLRSELISTINTDILNLEDSTAGDLSQGYARLFRMCAKYLTNYGKLMSSICDYIRIYQYGSNPPVEICVFNLYFDAVRQCYNNINTTSSSYNPSYYNAIATMQANITLSDGGLDYSGNQFDVNARGFVEQYLAISNRVTYAGNFYDYWASRMSTDDEEQAAERRATYFLSQVW